MIANPLLAPASEVGGERSFGPTKASRNTFDIGTTAVGRQRPHVAIPILPLCSSFVKNAHRCGSSGKFGLSTMPSDDHYCVHHQGGMILAVKAARIKLAGNNARIQ
jgi:hypothetical protein